MTMTNVRSSLIRSIGYNPTNEELSVTLQSTPSTVWNYRGVSRQTATAFGEATSKGQYFNSNIRGKFPTTKVAV